MTVLVDTSVWSLALRRDKAPPSREVDALTSDRDFQAVARLFPLRLA